MPTRTVLAACLTVLIASCGADDPKEAGLDALQRGRYIAAADHLQTAIGAVEAGSEEHLELAVARCQALANSDAPACQREFLGLATSSSGLVTAKDFSMVVNALIDARNYVPAIDIMDAGIKKFPDDATMVELRTNLITESKKAADPAAIRALESLGYLGGDS
jgi:hypothetical protein